MEKFNQIYAEYHKLVLNYILFKLKNLTISEELANDVFMRVYKHLDNYNEDLSSMKTWIMKITNNIVIDYYRKVKMDSISLDKNISNDSKTTIGDSFSSTTNPYKEYVSNETLDIIENEISSLGLYKDVANLYFNEDLPLNEVSEKLNIPLNTVKGQIFRARIKLVNKLETLRS